MFDAIAGSYDLNNRLHSLGRDQAWRRAAVRLCLVKPVDDVLDVACGTGDLTEAFAAASPASVIGLDFVPAMLDVARTKSARRRRPAGAVAPSFEHGDATALEFPDSSFDIVSIAFGIRNVKDPTAALKEFHRVLRPGGRLIILEFSSPENPVLRFLSDFYCRRVMPITASLIARDRSGAYKYLPKSVATFSSRGALKSLMADAGFSSITEHPMSAGICVGYLGHTASH